MKNYIKSFLHKLFYVEKLAVFAHTRYFGNEMQFIGRPSRVLAGFLPKIEFTAKFSRSFIMYIHTNIFYIVTVCNFCISTCEIRHWARVQSEGN